MSVESVDTVIETITPLLVTLADTTTQDRPAKRRAIDTIKQNVLKEKSSESAILLLSHLIDPLLTCTTSAIEYVREKAVVILECLIATCEQGKVKKSTIEKLLKAVKERLAVETTEEIRVLWMELCATLLSRLSNSKITYESELMMDIIDLAEKDAFAEVLKLAAKLIILYSETQAKFTDYACEKMIELTIPLLTHKHTAVRNLGLKAMEGVLTASPKGLFLLFEYDKITARLPVIPTMVFDSSAFVRDNLYKVLGKLLCNWSPRARYQYAGDVLPVMLAGIFDELPSIQETCHTSLSQVGQSCTRDLLEANIMDDIPEDPQVSKTLGLKHLVHICFDKSLVDLMNGTIDFIPLKQNTALDSLGLFLEYAQGDDIVRRLSNIVSPLMMAYANHTHTDTREKLFNIVSLLAKKLPNSDIYLDVLMTKLDKRRLATESDGLPDSTSVLITLVFLNKFISNSPLNTLQSTRVSNALEKPYLKDYIANNKEIDAQVTSIKNYI